MLHRSSPSRAALDAREEAKEGTGVPNANLKGAVLLLLAPAFSPHYGAGMLTQGPSKGLSQESWTDPIPVQSRSHS